MLRREDLIAVGRGGKRAKPAESWGLTVILRPNPVAKKDHNSNAGQGRRARLVFLLYRHRATGAPIGRSESDSAARKTGNWTPQ